MRTAVVTGAAGAIGAAICVRLLDRGYRVVGVDVDSAGLGRLPGAVVGVEADLTDPAAADLVVDAVRDGCDVLISNAGIVSTTPFEHTGRAEVLRELQVNLQAPMLLTQAVYPLLQRSRGQVVGVVSLGGLMPLAQSPGYTATKFGLRGFLLALALREQETGVRVSIVNPGSVDTPMLRHEAATGGSPLNFLGEPMSPGTVADAVVRQLGRPRLETNLPRHDGWLVKAVMLAPGLLRRLRPTLERMARPNLDKYRRRNGIV